MATSKAKVIDLNTVDVAFDRVKPLLDSLRDNLKAAAEAVGSEYDKLPDSEKPAFAKKVQAEYGWSRKRLGDFAKISRQLPEKQEIIWGGAPPTDFTIDQSNEIVRTPDALLREAAKQGMFDEKVSTRQIRELRRTGKVPVKVEPPRPTTDLQRIKVLMGDADSHICKASLKVGEILAIMEDSGITDAQGPAAKSLIQSFEKLCTKMAAANPSTSKRAFAILRGEA